MLRSPILSPGGVFGGEFLNNLLLFAYLHIQDFRMVFYRKQDESFWLRYFLPSSWVCLFKTKIGASEMAQWVIGAWHRAWRPSSWLPGIHAVEESWQVILRPPLLHLWLVSPHTHNKDSTIFKWLQKLLECLYEKSKQSPENPPPELAT